MNWQIKKYEIQIKEIKNMFSAVAITSFLASVGSVVGGGMAAGIGVIAGVSGAIGAAVGACIAKK